MKESSEKPSSTLGYLAAFTLGIICIGAIVLFMRAPKPAEGGSKEENTPQNESAPERIHFQRTNRLAGGRDSLQVPRTTTRILIPARRPSTEFADFQETAPVETAAPEEIQVPEPEISTGPRAAVVAVPVAAIPEARANGGRIAGRALLMFRPPPERELPLDATCGALFKGPPTTRFFVVGHDRGLADVLVVVAAGLPAQPWPVPQQPVTLRRRGCIYENQIVGVQAGQPLFVSNLDRVVHNIHTTPQHNRESNFAFLPRQRPLKFIFDEPELFVRFKCDVHPWEFAYVSVLDHPFFAVTDANGNFAITGLPEGRYTIEAHHRKAGVLRREITVDDHHNAKIDFEFRELPVQTQNI
jgi:hypothetical protein